MNNLSNIVVYIKDEAMLQEAREMLIANGCDIDDIFKHLSDMKDFNFLQRNNYGWFLGVKRNGKQVITLPELEQLLKQNRDETTTTS